MPSFRCSFLRSPAGAYRRSQRVSFLLARRPGKLVSSSLSAKRLRRRLNWLGAHAVVPLLVPPITSGRLSTLAEGVFLLARRPGKLVSSSLSAKRLRRRLNWLGAHAVVPLLVPPITSGRLSTLAECVFSARAAPRART